MAQESHDLLIDQLFKRINLGTALVERTGGTGEGNMVDSGRERARRKLTEHLDPFAIKPEEGKKIGN
ncbi:MAG: hypothetical protein HQM00_03325 [Magnetococcales bacterium]|nr:hypothetical protein [Magnetococcales bacterium]